MSLGHDGKAGCRALNTTHNKSIGTTPMKAFIGYETRSAAEASLLFQIQDAVHRLDLDELCADTC